MLPRSCYLAGLFLLSLLSARTGVTGDVPTTAGIWRTHEVRFQYQGFESVYACDWLEAKMLLLLDTSGARRHPNLTPSCRVLDRPATGAGVNMRFQTLAPDVAAADSGPTNAASAVSATWRVVTLRLNRPLSLEANDCELVEQFRDQVLPLFTTRNVVDRTNCRLGYNSAHDINLSFEVLVPATP